MRTFFEVGEGTRQHAHKNDSNNAKKGSTHGRPCCAGLHDECHYIILGEEQHYRNNVVCVVLPFSSIYAYIYIYTHTHTHRERERERETCTSVKSPARS